MSGADTRTVIPNLHCRYFLLPNECKSAASPFLFVSVHRHLRPSIAKTLACHHETSYISLATCRVQCRLWRRSWFLLSVIIIKGKAHPVKMKRCLGQLLLCNQPCAQRASSANIVTHTSLFVVCDICVPDLSPLCITFNETLFGTRKRNLGGCKRDR